MKRLERYDVVYNKSITSWDEALPLGNGKLGCLLYGDGPFRLAVDRTDLWDTRLAPATKEAGFTFQNLVRLVKSGKETDWKEYCRLFDSVYEDTPYPTKLTAGRIELDFGVKTDETVSRVILRSAIANVEINGGKTAKIEAFASATAFVGVARVQGEYALRLHIPDYISGDESGCHLNGSGIGNAEADGCLRYPRAKVVKDGAFTYYRQETKTDFSYGVVVLEKKYAGYSELYFTVATKQDGAEFISLAKEELSRAANIGYEALKKAHVGWWKRFWAKSEISVGDTLLEKTYYRSYYLFASCSRKGFYPMPLQGVWTADNDSLPPWKGDYHHDTNTQLSYQSFLKGNRMDEGSAFVDYLWSLKGEFEGFAKDFYGVEGLLIPGVSTIDGKPMGGWAHYALSPTMSVWTAQSFDEYWLYTADKTFLENRAYPFLKGVGDALAGLLEERNGKLYLPLTSSPEIFDATREAYLEPNSNFDLALLRYLYKTLVEYCRILGKNGEKYVEIYAKLDEIALIDGGVALDKTRKLHESHRHFSHLMCMYPLHLINFDTPEHKSVYEHSIFEIERLGTGNWVGFSFAMCAQIYAMARMGNSAYEKLRQFADGFVAENGFHLNGDFKNYGYSTLHYRPFTLESSFGFCDALQEMLLQEHQGYIDLFPAIPEKWKKASFQNLRSYGGVLVSAQTQDGAVTAFSVRSEKPITVAVKNSFGKEELRFSDGQTVRCKAGEIFTIFVDGKVDLL